MYKAPKAILNHPGVEECISGDAGGFDYKHDIFLKPEWEFTRGRNAGCRSLRAHTVKEFFEAKPKTNTGGRK